MRFLPNGIWWRRRKDYRAVFLKSDQGKRVLADMIRYASPDLTVIVPGDPLSTGAREGARLFINRITKILNLSDAEIRQLTEQERRNAPQKEAYSHDEDDEA